MRDATKKQEATHSAPAVPLFQPLEFVFVRAPLLPIEAYFRLSDQPDEITPSCKLLPTNAWKAGARATRDPRVRLALAVGSSSLLEALERAERSALTLRDAARLDAKLLRYLIRMSTRATPFGLFAGVALARWGHETTLELEATLAHTRTRPDMAWLLALVFELEARPEVRRHLSLVANPSATIQGDRVVLSSRAPAASSGPGSVSIRATGVVRRALALARQPIAHGDLVDRLTDATPNATPEKVEQLLTELWQHTLLLTDLRPSLTAANPAHEVANRLADIPAATDARLELEGILALAAAWDETPLPNKVSGYRNMATKASAVNRAAEQTPFQVDMAMALRRPHLARAVGDEVARAAEMLLRITPFPNGPPYLTSYRQAFVARYGYEREVPLLELLDASMGLGPPGMQTHLHAQEISPRKAKERSEVLVDLALSAVRDGRRVAELDPSTLASLETWSPTPDSAPVSVDLCAFVAATSAATLDGGEFQVVIGPNLGAQAAGRNLGRFVDMLTAEATAAMTGLAQAEERHAPAALRAELVYLPARFRSANVAIHPAMRSHEIVYAVNAGVPSARVIPIDELVVGVRNARFYVRWLRDGREVVVCTGHMLNNANAPDHCQFLANISQDRRALLSSFDWGPAAGFPFLPRVQAGRIVLRPAEWRISERSLSINGDALDRWRGQWNVPRHVCLSAGDNRLILDLDDARQVSELHSEIRDLRHGKHVVLQEVLPGLDQVWLPGPDGRYLMEIVVSLVLRGESRRPADDPPFKPSVAGAPHNGAARPIVPQEVRLRPPGTDWLFVKLYCSRTLEEDLIAYSIHTFAEETRGEGLVQEWFFVRYSDPDPHIRLRFRGEAVRLTAALVPRLFQWGAQLMAAGLLLRFALDTYDREVERYGGAEGTALSETLFAADSRAVAGLLELVLKRNVLLDRTTLAILSVDDLLAGLGFSVAERLAWYKDQSDARQEVGQAYRERKTLLRALLGDEQSLLAQPGGAAVDSIFAARRLALAAVAERLRGVPPSLAILCSSYVHLHFNRLMGSDAIKERIVLGLLLRTRESLDRSPVAHPASSKKESLPG